MKSERREIYCCSCEADVIALLVTGSEVYPHRPDLESLPFWKCPSCSNFVGCHHKTKNRTKPLGYIPSPAIKVARKKIHAVIDPAWQSGKVKRKDLYRELSEVIGRKYHTAELRTVDEAAKVLKHLEGMES